MPKGEKRRERELAFQILYGLSFSPAPDLSALERAYLLSPSNPHANTTPGGFAWRLVRGVWENEEALNRTIALFSHNWRADRIGRIEMLLLRMALYEMLYAKTPAKIVISESLELAKQFGVSGAVSFINGILDAAAKAKPETADAALNNFK